jgi:hypothetical protein
VGNMQRGQHAARAGLGKRSAPPKAATESTRPVTIINSR